MCSDEKEDVESAFLSNQFWKLLTLNVKVTEGLLILENQQLEKFNEMDGLTLLKKQIVAIINDRWYFMHSSMHCVGIVLDPEWLKKG
jgi:hypothetical protein